MTNSQDELFAFTDEELRAIHHQIPMTEELYESCIEKCDVLGGDACVTQVKLFNEFPELYYKYRFKHSI